MSDSTTTSEGTASTDADAGSGGGALPPAAPAADSGAQPDAGALATELEAANRRARDEQGRADRLQAEITRLQAAGNPPAADPTPATGLTVEQFRAEIRRTREFDLATAELRQSAASADAGLFTDPADRFESVEAYRAAVEASHRTTEERVNARLTEAEQALRARYAEQYGPLDPAAPDVTTPTGDGLPSPEALLRMSMDEMDALEAKHGVGVIDRIIASATGKDG